MPGYPGVVLKVKLALPLFLVGYDPEYQERHG
jgi:hypothetical protein